MFGQNGAGSRQGVRDSDLHDHLELAPCFERDNNHELRKKPIGRRENPNKIIIADSKYVSRLSPCQAIAAIQKEASTAKRTEPRISHQDTITLANRKMETATKPH
jgi:hypothetical protein